MIVFTPTNETNTCGGVDAYNSFRTAATPSFYQANLGLFLASLLLWGGSLIWCWLNRHHPRMKTVRPFLSNVILVTSMMTLSVALSLNLATPSLPCGVYMFTLIGGLGGCGVHFYIMLTIFVIESHFAQNLGKYAATLRTSTDETTSIRSMPSRWAATLSFIKIAIGLSSLRTLTFEELIALKNAYAVIAFFVLLPACIPILVLFITLPVYQTCTGCALFIEPFIGFLGVYSICTLAAARILWVARSSRFVDTLGVYAQLRFLLFAATPIAVPTILLTILDPNNLSFNHQFMYFEWPWGAMMQVVYWWGMIGQNILHVYRDTRSKHSSSPVTTPSFGLCFSELDRRPSLRNRFEQYSIEHFAVENFYFVEDVKHFKSLFYTKTDTWRLFKLKTLVDMYIRNGALMEINISDEIRMNLLSHAHGITPATSISIYDLFDRAVTDITSNILLGLWSEFLNREEISLV
jgi:hypothetical protein